MMFQIASEGEAESVRGELLTPSSPTAIGPIVVSRNRLSMAGAAGWRPETLASADDSFAHPCDPCPSCLILDLSLPGLNGLDLQTRIADRPETAIILIPGHGDIPKTVQAMKAAPSSFLTKPFDDDVLLAAIRQAIEHSRTTLVHRRNFEP